MWHFKNARHLQFLEAPTVSKHPSFISGSSNLSLWHALLALHIVTPMYVLKAQALFLHTPVGGGVAPALCEHLLFPITCWSPCWWGNIPWVCMHTAEVWVPTCCTLHCQSFSRIQSTRSLYWPLRDHAYGVGATGAPVLVCWHSLEKGVCLHNCWFSKWWGSSMLWSSAAGLSPQLVSYLFIPFNCGNLLPSAFAHSIWTGCLCSLVNNRIETDWQVSSLPDDHHAGVLAALFLHLPFNQNAKYINAKLAIWLLPCCSLQKW